MSSRLMVDTNVLLDLLSVDRPHHRDARSLFDTGLRLDNCEFYALASSLKDVYYLYRRWYGSEELARRNVTMMAGLLTLCDCDAELVYLALESDEPDLEDGLVRCAAERAQLDGIVTRDAAGFLSSTVRKFNVAEATELLRSQR